MELLHGEAPTVVDPRQMAGEVAVDQVAEEPKAAEVPRAAFVVHIFCDLYCASTEEHTKYCRGRGDFFDQVLPHSPSFSFFLLLFLLSLLLKLCFVLFLLLIIHVFVLVLPLLLLLSLLLLLLLLLLQVTREQAE